jgi:uncharacterized protein YcfJ
MRNKIISAAVLTVASLSFVATPIAAEAQQRRVLVCEKSKKKVNNGTIIGAVAGGVLGNQIAGNGARTEGTLLGAGVGAVAGHEIAKKKAKKKCRYVYR